MARRHRHATDEILFFTDVRQELDSGALRNLVENFADPTVGAVTGELRILAGDKGEQFDLGLYWRYELWARRQHSEIYSLFNTTGCLYAVRRKLAGSIPPQPPPNRWALFLGLLEMACKNCIQVEQTESFGPVWLMQIET